MYMYAHVFVCMSVCLGEEVVVVKYKRIMIDMFFNFIGYKTSSGVGRLS
jgi:hypothetical protein